MFHSQDVQAFEPKEKKAARVARKFAAAHTWMMHDRPATPNTLENYVKRLYVDRMNSYVAQMNCPNLTLTEHRQEPVEAIKAANQRVNECLAQINFGQTDLRLFLIYGQQGNGKWDDLLSKTSECLRDFDQILDELRVTKCHTTQE